MTIVETVKAHSVESIDEMIEKFDIDEDLVPDVSYNSPKAKQQIFKNVLHEADGYYNYRYNKKFELHQIEKLEIKGRKGKTEKDYLLEMVENLSEDEELQQKLKQAISDKGGE